MHNHQIRLDQRKSALDIILKLVPDDDVVGAGAVVDPEGRAAAITGRQVGESIFGALGPGNRFPASITCRLITFI